MAQSSVAGCGPSTAAANTWVDAEVTIARKNGASDR